MLPPKSPGVAVIFSILLVGAGSMYVGHVARGVLLFATAFTSGAVLGCLTASFGMVGALCVYMTLMPLDAIMAYCDASRQQREWQARYGG